MRLQSKAYQEVTKNTHRAGFYITTQHDTYDTTIQHLSHVARLFIINNLHCILTNMFLFVLFMCLHRATSYEISRCTPPISVHGTELPSPRSSPPWLLLYKCISTNMHIYVSLSLSLYIYIYIYIYTYTYTHIYTYRAPPEEAADCQGFRRRRYFNNSENNESTHCYRITGSTISTTVIILLLNTRDGQTYPKRFLPELNKTQ